MIGRFWLGAWARLGAAVIACALLCLVPAGAASDAALTASQSSATLETGRSTVILLNADNPPAGATLRIEADAGIGWTLRRVAAGQWELRVSPQPRLTSDGTITAVLQGGSGRRLAVQQVKVSPKALPSADSVMRAELAVDGDRVVEGRKTPASLILSNKSEFAVALRDIQPVTQREIQITFDAEVNRLIMPRETVVIPATLSVAKGVVPIAGKHQVAVRLGFTTNLNQKEAGRAGSAHGPENWTAWLLASREVALEVPGLSDLQGVLQIPSLLLLPGLLCLIAFTAALDRAKPSLPGEDPLARISVVLNPALWVVAITLSGVIGAAYAWLFGRNILYGFGIWDIACLWFASLILGGLAGGYAYCREKRRQELAAAPRFAPGLSPLDTLRQLVREGEPLRRTVRILNEALLFDLGPGDSERSRWASGAIMFRAVGAPDAQMLTQIRDATSDGQRVELIADYVGQAKLALAWKPFLSGAVRIEQPTIVSADLFTGIAREDDILQEAV